MVLGAQATNVRRDTHARVRCQLVECGQAAASRYTATQTMLRPTEHGNAGTGPVAPSSLLIQLQNTRKVQSAGFELFAVYAIEAEREAAHGDALAGGCRGFHGEAEILDHQVN